MVGENDVFVPAKKSVLRLSRVAPGVKCVVVTDAGHDLAIVQTELVTNEILNFFKTNL